MERIGGLDELLAIMSDQKKYLGYLKELKDVEQSIAAKLETLGKIQDADRLKQEARGELKAARAKTEAAERALKEAEARSEDLLHRAEERFAKKQIEADGLLLNAQRISEELVNARSALGEQASCLERKTREVEDLKAGADAALAEANALRDKYREKLARLRSLTAEA